MPDKINLYSKRLLQPFVGVVQVADLNWARALSLDGINWAVRYSKNENKQTRHARFSHDPRVNLSMIVNIEGNEPDTRIIRQTAKPEEIYQDSQRIFDVLHNTQVPFAAADNFEYWLIDNSDSSPLALLHTCINEEDMQQPVPPPEWFSIPAAELAITDPLSKGTTYQLPINARLQQLIQESAGNKPKAVWFDRRQSSSTYFPPCLIKDTWDNSEYQRICELYLDRIAPRLLMVDKLPYNTRQSLEKAAREHALDVDQFFPLYPEVIDDNFLNAARVEARLRRCNES